jgi:hypothetical protein
MTILDKRGIEVEHFFNFINQDEDGNEVDETQRFAVILETRTSTGGQMYGVLTTTTPQDMIWLFLTEGKWTDGYPLYALDSAYDLKTGERLDVDIRVGIGDEVVERNF